MDKKRKKSKHNAETIRLAKAIPFTAKDLYYNKNGKLTEEQVSDVGKYLWPTLATMVGFLVLFVVIDMLILTGVIDFSQIRSSRRLITTVGIGFILVFGTLSFLVSAIKTWMSIMDLKNVDIQVYTGDIKRSQRRVNGEMMFYLHFGTVRWHINPKFYEMFQEGYEYTVYYLSRSKAILSVNASDPRFNQPQVT